MHLNIAHTLTYTRVHTNTQECPHAHMHTHTHTSQWLKYTYMHTHARTHMTMKLTKLASRNAVMLVMACSTSWRTHFAIRISIGTPYSLQKVTLLTWWKPSTSSSVWFWRNWDVSVSVSRRRLRRPHRNYSRAISPWSSFDWANQHHHCPI